MFLSITGATEDNKLAKYQPFEKEADAVAHAKEYNGFSIKDPEGDRDFWAVDMAKKTVTRDDSAATTAATARKMVGIRSKRDALLAETDWMANSDVTMSDAWKAYRKALRDVPAQADMDKITWPTKP
jgi:hypothetical protein|tara:strand:+ start:743 stop:1123 length:381 start_codon:yes stop_codon:yes gene_type:complete